MYRIQCRISEISAAGKTETGDPRARAKLLAFYHRWLQLDRLHDLAKDTKRFPGFDAAIVSDLRTSLGELRSSAGDLPSPKELLKTCAEASPAGSSGGK